MSSSDESSGSEVSISSTVCFVLRGSDSTSRSPLTPAGLGGCVIEMVERGLVDFIISTGANLYHDLHYALNFTLRRACGRGLLMPMSLASASRRESSSPGDAPSSWSTPGRATGSRTCSENLVVHGMRRVVRGRFVRVAVPQIDVGEVLEAKAKAMSNYPVFA